MTNRPNVLKQLLDRSDGQPRGVLAVTCANEFVIKTCMESAKKRNTCFLVEATVNQVNQYGGYTGMKPADFAVMIQKIAQEIGFPLEKLILCGDHLGPHIWKDLPENDAMARSKELVYQYVAAGFRKIHLDTSMNLSSDNPTLPVNTRVIAERSAELAIVAEQAYADTKNSTPWPFRPVYVIGSEVPVPGGTEEEVSMQVTKPADLNNTLLCFKDVLLKHNLSMVWDDVVAVVAQIGVEFSDKTVHDYSHEAALELSAALKQHAGIVFESHSSDYQISSSLRNMVLDGVGILKVGPELTYVFREGLFSLAMMEKELLALNLNLQPSGFIERLEKVMLESEPNYWAKYYQGTPEQQGFKRKYSYSDRSRYYLSEPSVKDAYTRLIENMSSIDIPYTLISQYMPVQYTKIREGQLESSPIALLKDKISCVMERYYSGLGI